MATKKKAPVVPADFYVAFAGSSGQINVDEPSRGQQVEYTVFGTIHKYEEADRGDGETRFKYIVTVEAAWPKGSSRPDNANQASMVDHEGKVNPEATGEASDDGGELIDTANAADD